MALKSDGTVWAGGWNKYGQLGDGAREQCRWPVKVVDSAGEWLNTNVIAVAAGENHTVALKSDGTVWAWGDNDNGQLGDGTRKGDHDTPVKSAEFMEMLADHDEDGEEDDDEGEDEDEDDEE